MFNSPRCKVAGSLRVHTIDVVVPYVCVKKPVTGVSVIVTGYEDQLVRLTEFLQLPQLAAVLPFCRSLDLCRTSPQLQSGARTKLSSS